jgi:glucose dehydrogenase
MAGLKVLLLTVVVVLAVPAAAPARTGAPRPPAKLAPPAYAGAQWRYQNGDLQGDRYSTLKQINRSNVAKLQVAWTKQLNTGLFSSVEAFPLVYGNMMITTAGNSTVHLLNAATGELIRTIQGPQAVNRGAAVGDGKLFAADGQGGFAAWDLSTGQQVWKTLYAPPGVNGRNLPRPGPNAVYFDHKIFLGTTGNDSQVLHGGVSGAMNAFNADTGAPLWSWFAVPLKPGDAGAETWGDPAELGNGGGGNWLWSSIDPQNKLLFFGTGNAEPYYGRAQGKNLYTAGVVALRTDSGRLKWQFQLVHHDMWDYDCATPPVLWNYEFHGKMTPGIEVTCKSGYYYEFNRVTGKPLIPIHEKQIPNLKSNPAAVQESNAWPTQPVPEGQSPVPHCVKRVDMPGPAPDGQPYDYSCTFAAFGRQQFVAMTPSPLNNFNFMSFSPQTGYAYVCDAINNIGLKSDPAHGPTAFFGTNGPATTRYVLGGYPFANPHMQLGVVAALNLQNNKIVWQHKWYADRDGVCYGGLTSTAGGLVFTTSQQGYLYAYDAKTGKQLYANRVCGNQLVASPPMVYAVNGKEYVEQACGGSLTGDVNSTVTTNLPRHDQTVVLTLPGR